MDSLAIEELLSSIDWYSVVAFGSIPVVASLIGYGTNVLAIQVHAKASIAS